VDSSDWPPRFRWLARFLLQGDVILGLKEYTDSLLTPPAVMVKSWAQYVIYIFSFIHHLTVF